MRLLPRSLLWRTFLFVALLMMLSVAAWFAIFRSYEREPRARQLAQTLVSVANLTRAALISARPEARRELLRDLSDREGIHIYPADAADRVAPLPDRPFLRLVEELVQEQMGPGTRLTLEREGERALFINFRVDDSDEGGFWLALPRERIDRVFPLGWLGWGVAALLLSLVGAWLIVYRITRPLKALVLAARKVGAGETATRLDEGGPSELATVAHAFNQMSADLAQMDQDRALILAGISHDLRTPLTRLRMGIEMAADEGLREGMTVDVEEMDKTIGQFLDFARSEGGEAQQDVDVAALLGELAAQYRRRGFQVEFTVPPAPTFTRTVSVRPQGLRRAISNLIDNALRHAGNQSPVELAVGAAPGEFSIEVSDDGPGIPAEEVERMKRPFARLEAARTNAVGAGLGLAIVDRVARSHNGRLELLPRPGGGLIARLVLPAPDQPPSTAS
ncbi:MAG: two-component system OmpR family osmolarity sensor histidine kinase EnvZ [Rhodocyclaceae bacterium]|nr:MAG: two-component system OmpR family osmolarity sensor histidine kinase EnvZ [Rhodocyclaceae bacterium]TND00442.1 MAG: two-component system, OmpR family, osmolarity sensor histidine kinase EnvZ [Rhodocyclaceae bacterium]